jgi:hypothetical protein
MNHKKLLLSLLVQVEREIRSTTEKQRNKALFNDTSCFQLEEVGAWGTSEFEQQEMEKLSGLYLLMRELELFLGEQIHFKPDGSLTEQGVANLRFNQDGQSPFTQLIDDLLDLVKIAPKIEALQDLFITEPEHIHAELVQCLKEIGLADSEHLIQIIDGTKVKADKTEIDVMDMVEQMLLGMHRNPQLRQMIQNESFIELMRAVKPEARLKQLCYMSVLEVLTREMMDSIDFTERMVAQVIANQNALFTDDPDKRASQMDLMIGGSKYSKSVFAGLKLLSCEPGIWRNLCWRQFYKENNTEPDPRNREHMDWISNFIARYKLDGLNVKTILKALSEQRWKESEHPGFSFNIYEAFISERPELRNNSFAALYLINVLQGKRHAVAYQPSDPARPTTMVSDGDSRERPVIGKIALSKEFAQLYNSWNLAFVVGLISVRQFTDMVMAKLLVPSTLAALPENYSEARVLSLWLTLNFAMYRNKYNLERGVTYTYAAAGDLDKFALALAAINAESAHQLFFDEFNRATFDQAQELLYSSGCSGICTLEFMKNAYQMYRRGCWNAMLPREAAGSYNYRLDLPSEQQAQVWFSIAAHNPTFCTIHLVDDQLVCNSYATEDGVQVDGEVLNLLERFIHNYVCDDRSKTKALSSLRAYRANNESEPIGSFLERIRNEIEPYFGQSLVRIRQQQQQLKLMLVEQRNPDEPPDARLGQSF